MARVLFPALVSFLAIAACSGPAEPVTETAPMPSEAPKTWAIATANPHATDAGAAILAKGGSAVDAAVAVQAVLGLVEPQSSGLGGGAFMIHYDASSQSLTAFDGREIAPASARPDMFLKDSGQPMGFYDAVVSGKSVGVPGAVAMLDMAHQAHGKLTWSELFDDAERLAVDGFAISPRLNSLLARFTRLEDNPVAKETYFDADGAPLAAGTLFKNPAYANTVRTIADGGAEAFYNGPLTDDIIRVVNNKTGEETFTRSDFAEYAPTIRPNVCGGFFEYRICSMGPPSSGGVTVLQILGLFERSVTEQMSVGQAWARFLEGSRLAFADRALYLADPGAMAQWNVSSDDVVEALVSDSYLDHRSTLIGEAAADTVEAGNPVEFLDLPAADGSPDLPGTSHFSILDGDGNIVSMTTTVEFAFGSHLIAGGMILNNQLTDFSFVPERDGQLVANAAGPRKKPRSSMSPVIVFEGETPIIAIGSPGGPAIIGYVAKSLVAALYLDQPLQAAVDHPHLVNPRGTTYVEENLPADIQQELIDYGYDVKTRALTSGLYGFRLHPDGTVEGAADTRREGTFKSGIIQ